MIESSGIKYSEKDFDYYLESHREDMVPYIPQNAKVILDVGCAAGGFGALLKSEFSAEVWGVELSEYAAFIAAQRLDKVV